jgi:hypothetical protein
LIDLFEKLGLSGKNNRVSWGLTPQVAFSTFESWSGNRLERVLDSSHRYYFFYVDYWTPPARLLLMERSVQYARKVAAIDAPQELLDSCVAEQGYNCRDKNYAINDALKKWLQENIVDGKNLDLVHKLYRDEEEELHLNELPTGNDPAPDIEPVRLRREGIIVSMDDAPRIVREHDFYDSRLNPAGSFENYLVNNQDGLTVSDLKTGLMWQLEGCTITSIKSMTNKYIAGLNRQRFGGYNDWRLPTIPEALSLLEPQANEKGLFMHPCFSREQPYIFLADRRRPGGYWFVDFRQAMIFWASGTIPGGFGRVCRSL